MQFLEYPYVIITILAGCFLVLTAIGVSFAVRGIKTANGVPEKDFSSIGKMESAFAKNGKLREERFVTHISVNLENFRSLYSEAETAKLFSEIKRVLLNAFFDENSSVSLCGEKSFVALSKCDANTARERVSACVEQLNQLLLKNGALKIVDIRFGGYAALGTEVSFDEAMSRAKKACMVAKNENIPYAEWNVSQGKALEKKIKIENNIEKEIDNNRFFLEYQPVLDAKTKKIIGAEVLARLNSETDGVLTPGSFLSAVDSVGLNDKFDYYIFEKNCKWISNDKKNREPYQYTINFSRSTLCEPAFAEKIISIAEKYDLKFSCLAVEILEDKNVTGDARKQMIDNLSVLKEKGISVLLDDFGSGYTTFGDLQNLDVSIVKIDKSITQNATNETGFIILKNIVRTSQDIGFKTLCEGIETKEQEEAAIRAGCDFLQGFYYYRPMPVAQLERVFDKDAGGI